MRRATIAGLFALLAGCATHYTAPTSGPTATVTFSASGLTPGSTILVQNFDNESCAPSPTGTRLATFTTTAVQGKGDPHSGAVRILPAERPAVVTFAYQAGASGFTDTETCEITQSFIPTVGARYRVAFEKSGGICSVFVLREDGNDPKAVDALHQVKNVCFNKING